MSSYSSEQSFFNTPTKLTRLCESNRMRIVVLACKVFEPELEFLRQQMEAAPIVHYLEQGLHEDPRQLHASLQDAVTTLEKQYGKDLRIACAYGLCGQGMHGVRTTLASLVVPQSHDCISLLLGKRTDEAVRSRVYWMSPGWLLYSQLPFIRERETRHREYTARYGHDNAEFLLEQERTWLTGYDRACFICWEGLDGQWRGKARLVAADAGLSYTEYEGDSGWLKALLEGGRDPKRFFQLSPGQTIGVGADGILRVMDAGTF